MQTQSAFQKTNIRLSEAQIKKQILDFLYAQRDCAVFPIPTTGMWDIKRKMFRKSAGRLGAPDILLCRNGKFIGIEVKAAKGRVSPAQQECIEEINEKGGAAIVARSLDDVIAFFAL